MLERYCTHRMLINYWIELLLDGDEWRSLQMQKGKCCQAPSNNKNRVELLITVVGQKYAFIYPSPLKQKPIRTSMHNVHWSSLIWWYGKCAESKAKHWCTLQSEWNSVENMPKRTIEPTFDLCYNSAPPRIHWWLDIESLLAICGDSMSAIQRRFHSFVHCCCSMVIFRFGSFKLFRFALCMKRINLIRGWFLLLLLLFFFRRLFFCPHMCCTHWVVGL